MIRPVQSGLRIVLHLFIPRNLFQHLSLPHPFGIVITERTIIEGEVTVFQNVTIGKNELHDWDGAPIIETGVVVFPGAVIIGGIRIGCGAVIGANAVVNQDVPPYTIVAGAPARRVGAVAGTYEREVRRRDDLRMGHADGNEDDV